MKVIDSVEPKKEGYTTRRDLPSKHVHLLHGHRHRRTDATCSENCHCVIALRRRPPDSSASQAIPVTTIPDLAQGKPVRSRVLCEVVWGMASIEHTENLRVLISQLRKMLESDPEHPRYIFTEPRVGYLFEASSEGTFAPAQAEIQKS